MNSWRGVVMHIKRWTMVLIAVLLTLLLGGCRFAVVESDSIQVGFGIAAHAESDVIGLDSWDSATDTRVAQLQRRLKELDYLDDEADGIFGKNTLNALKEFQRANALQESGVLDSQTEAALYSDAALPMPTPAPSPCGPGDSGTNVEIVQTQLSIYGFTTEPVDGVYGEATQEAVKAFQNYAVAHYGTEFDEPLPEPTPTPESDRTDGNISVQNDAAETAIPELPVPSPEPTLRPDYDVNGEVSLNLYAYLVSGRFPVYRQTVQCGDSGEEVLRIQNRLANLEYFYEVPDGIFGGLTENALKFFQARNGLQETGIADAETQARLFSADAIAPEEVDMPYYIKISIDDQKVYVYRWRDGGYNHLIKIMICSTGTTSHPTPLGIFTSAGHSGGRWHYFNEYKCWGQYAFNIHNDILFHSVLYSKKDESTLRQGSVDSLGKRASHGCIRLRVEDAKWIYENCERGQVIEIY